MRKEERIERERVTEEILIARMEERWREGDVSDELREFFEFGGLESPIPLFFGGKKKKRVVRAGTRTEHVERAAPADQPSGCYPPPTNRGVTFNDDDETPDFEGCPKILGGYDGGTTLGFEGEWNNPAKSKITMHVFEKAKEKATDEENPDGVFELWGRYYVMQGKSVREGGKEKGKGVTYKYVFEGDGVKFYVHSNPKADQQPIRIRYNAEGVIGRDMFHKHWALVKMLREWGFEVKGEKLSRVDGQVMLFCELSDIFDPSSRDRIVCSARKGSYHFDGLESPVETFTLGSKEFIQVCIYDKRAEMNRLRKQNPLKYQLMIQECFGEEWELANTPTTRVEFRIGRKLLKAMNINSMEDLLECENALFQYCCNKWFRVLKEKKRRGHTSLQEVSDKWREVQEAFATWFPGVEGHNREVRRNYREDVNVNSEQLDRQSAGCMSTAIAMAVGVVETIEEVKTYCYKMIDTYAEKILARSQERAVRLGIRVREFVEADMACIADWHLPFTDFESVYYEEPEKGIEIAAQRLLPTF